MWVLVYSPETLCLHSTALLYTLYTGNGSEDKEIILVKSGLMLGLSLVISGVSVQCYLIGIEAVESHL